MHTPAHQRSIYVPTHRCTHIQKQAQGTPTQTHAHGMCTSTPLPSRVPQTSLLLAIQSKDSPLGTEAKSEQTRSVPFIPQAETLSCPFRKTWKVLSWDS